MIGKSTKVLLQVAVLTFICTCSIGLNRGMAQRDMILTQAGEQLRCRIIDETPVRFVFAYLKDGKPYRSEIFKNLVTSFKFNYYEADLPNADKLPEAMYRATEGIDSQSPRALSSATPKSAEKKSGRKKRTRKRGNKELPNEATPDDITINEEKVSEAVGEAATKEAGINQQKDEPSVTTADPEQKLPPKSVPEKSQSGKVVSTKAKESPTEGTPAVVAKKEEPKADNTTTLREANASATSTKQDQITDSKRVASVKKDTLTDAVWSTSESRDLNRNTSTEGEVRKEDDNSILEKEARLAASKTKSQPDKPVDLAPDIADTELPNITINQENKFRIGLKGGIGNRLDNNLQTINSYDLYLEQLLRGWTLGADIAYFPNDMIGFGAIFTDFKSRNSDSEILYRNEFTGAELVGSVANNRSVKFIGPALFVRKKLDYKTYVVLGLAPGYNFYRDRGSYDGVDYTFTGGGFGAASTLGIDFLLGNDIIGRDIILSFEAGYNYGKINALDYGDARGLVDLAQPLDVSRLDFTVGLRFIRFPKYFRLTSY